MSDFVVVSFGVTMEADAWYDNPQPVLRPDLAQCATPCVRGCLYAWVVQGYCHTNNAGLVSVRALYCIFIVSSPGC